MSGKNARNYTHLYDKSMYTSMWTAYPVYSSAMGSLTRPKWSNNPEIPTNYQISLWDGSYDGGTTYSRGHLIPNGSRNGISEMQKQTFYATNSVPQRQNRFNGTIWSNLENAIRGLVSSASDTVYVVTGVAFQKKGGSETIKWITPNCDTKQCPVPNYFYKVVLKVKRDGSKKITSASTVGIWMEHRDYKSSEEYADFAVSVDQIEEWTGFDFFANLPESLQTTVEQNESWSTFAAFK